jgi:hypothetical protein
MIFLAMAAKLLMCNGYALGYVPIAARCLASWQNCQLTNQSKRRKKTKKTKNPL